MALIITVAREDVVRFTGPDGQVILLRGGDVRGYSSMRIEIEAERSVKIDRLGKYPLSLDLRDFKE